MKTLLIAATLIALYLIVSTMDYQDELDEEQRYIEFVCDGVWPDYRNLNPECEK